MSARRRERRAALAVLLPDAGLGARTAGYAVLAVSALASALPAWRAAHRPAARVLRDD